MTVEKDNITEAESVLRERQVERKTVGDDGSNDIDGILDPDQMTIMEASSKAMEQCEDFVRHVWDAGWSVVQHSALPQWLQDNHFLIDGHRPQLNSFWTCFKSIFCIHTETGNIWTHLIGFVAFVCVTLYFLFRPSDEIEWQQKAVFSAFFAGALLCLGLSTIFHTVHCHSKRISKLFNKLDYCGIAFLIMGSSVPWIYYSFYCSPNAKLFYLGLVLTLGTGCIVVSLWERFSEPRFRTLRAAMFVAFGLSGVFPAAHHVIVSGFHQAVHIGSLGWLALMGALYIFGAVLYASRIPERLCPGKFDIWFQSHQIFHILVVIAAFVHYHTITKVANLHLLKAAKCLDDAF